jgi:hypothetical protein
VIVRTGDSSSTEEAARTLTSRACNLTPPSTTYLQLVEFDIHDLTTISLIHSEFVSIEMFFDQRSSG